MDSHSPSIKLEADDNLKVETSIPPISTEAITTVPLTDACSNEPKQMCEQKALESETLKESLVTNNYEQKDPFESFDVNGLQASFSFLPLVCETLDLIQRNSPVTQISKSSIALANKFKQSIALIDKLPGANLSIQQQEELIDKEMQVLKHKR